MCIHIKDARASRARASVHTMMVGGDCLISDNRRAQKRKASRDLRRHLYGRCRPAP